MIQEIFIKDPDYKSELKYYQIQGYVYIKDNGLPTDFSKSIHELDKLKIMTVSHENAFRLSLEHLEKAYPYYKSFIRLKLYE